MLARVCSIYTTSWICDFTNADATKRFSLINSTHFAKLVAIISLPCKTYQCLQCISVLTKRNHDDVAIAIARVF